MTPARYRECLAALGWSMTFLADWLGIHPTTAQNWGRGRGKPIPANVAEWLELRATHAAEFPLPRGWTQRYYVAPATTEAPVTAPGRPT